MNIIFGPVQSRRFGNSLGVDLSPTKKQCNFDCVYCELRGAKSVERFDEIVPVDLLLNATKSALKTHKNIDVLTITANGEPTLYPHLEDFILGIKPFLPQNIKTLILSNGSKFGDKSVQNALNHFDMVKFSLDSGAQKTYKKIDRIHKSLDLDSIMNGIESYAKIRRNVLICEILLVKNINDNDESLIPLADFLRKIGVDRVDIGTIDRPPAYSVEAVDMEQISNISKLFYNLCVSIPMRKKMPSDLSVYSDSSDSGDCSDSSDSNATNRLHLSESEILDLLKRRPLEVNEMRNMLSIDSLKCLQNLADSHQIKTKFVGQIAFYLPQS